MTQQLRSEQRADYEDNLDGGITGETHQDFVDSAHMVARHTLTTLTNAISSDNDYTRFDTTANAVTGTLPLLADANQQRYEFKWVAGANAAVVEGNGAEQIEGSDDYTFATLGDALALRPGPTQWEIVSEYLNA